MQLKEKGCHIMTMSQNSEFTVKVDREAFEGSWYGLSALTYAFAAQHTSITVAYRTRVLWSTISMPIPEESDKIKTRDSAHGYCAVRQ